MRKGDWWWWEVGRKFHFQTLTSFICTCDIYILKWTGGSGSGAFLSSSSLSLFCLFSSFFVVGGGFENRQRLLLQGGSA